MTTVMERIREIIPECTELPDPNRIVDRQGICHVRIGDVVYSVWNRGEQPPKERDLYWVRIDPELELLSALLILEAENGKHYWNTSTMGPLPFVDAPVIIGAG